MHKAIGQAKALLSDLQAQNPDMDHDALFRAVAMFLLAMEAKRTGQGFVLDVAILEESVISEFFERVAAISNETLLKLRFPGFV